MLHSSAEPSPAALENVVAGQGTHAVRPSLEYIPALQTLHPPA